VSTFGERLRQVRLGAGLSQSQLAGEGLSASYISLLEAGKRTPSHEVVRQLAARLGCPPDQLADDREYERDERVALELRYARLAVMHGQAAKARVRLERLLASGDLAPRLRDEAAYLVGVACDRSGDRQSALKVLLPLFERARAGKAHLLVHVLGLSLVGCYLDAGDAVQAVVVGERALASAEEQGFAETDDYLRLATVVLGACVECGDHTRARAWTDLLLQAQADDHSPGRRRTYWGLGQRAEAAGRISDALVLYGEALRQPHEIDPGDPVWSELSLAVVLLGGDPPRVDDALAVLERCAADLACLGEPTARARWNWARSVALLLAGDVVGAESHARQALDLAGGRPLLEAAAQQALADVLAARGDDPSAAEAHAAAVVALREGPVSHAQALGWRELAERLAVQDAPAAMDAFRHALDAAGVPDRSRVHRAQVAALRAHSSVPASQASRGTFPGPLRGPFDPA
jgi:transcriptional regulator with XRE-family HTH domain